MKNNFISNFKWVLFVSRRFARVDRTGRSRINAFLASLGICLGVMTLITVISVMNGFQMSFIDSIMEVSSYHIRAEGLTMESAADFQMYCDKEDLILSASPFYEAQSLMTGARTSQAACLIRAVPKNMMERDKGFKKEAKVWAGEFNLEQGDSIVLGTELARRLGVTIGRQVNLFALSGGNDVELLSGDRIFTVTGMVRTGYADINSSFAFISLDDGLKYLGKDAKLIYGLKLKKTELDSKVIARLKSDFPDLHFESWKEYNKSFFSTLRIEKNMLLLLVLIIFIVVAINIFNGMRRMVFEKREEIAILSAFGGKKNLIQSIFITQGFLTGVKGALPGLVMGLLLSVQMPRIFIIMSNIVYYSQVFMLKLLNPADAHFVRPNSTYMFYANIPPRIFVGEVLLITVFGVFSALFASYVASKNVLRLTVSEVMRDE